MQPREDDVLKSKTDPKPSILSLPQLHGSHSLNELVSHSRSMSATPSTSADESEGALADSTYEVVDTRHLVSDDELDVQSESLPSCGGNTTDCDVSSVADTEEHVDNQASVASLSHMDYPTPAPSEEELDDDGEDEDVVEESSATVHPEQTSRSTLIQFPEPNKYLKQGRLAGTALVKQQIANVLPGKLTPELRDSMSTAFVPVSLQMRLSETPLHPNGTYSVMLVGNISNAKRDVLMPKIASALATGSAPGSAKSSTPTRLSVVPVSPFSLTQSCPDVALIQNIGTELMVQTCTDLRKIDGNKSHHPSSLQAKINDEWVSLKEEVSAQDNPCGLPHSLNLAVYLHNTPDPAMSTQDDGEWIWDVEEVFFDQGVPGIHLTPEAQWVSNVDSDSLLQMTSQFGDNYATSPVDIDTFLRLHNGQLGRHLSFLEAVRQDILQKKHDLDPWESLMACVFEKDGSMKRIFKQTVLSACLAFLFLLMLVAPPSPSRATSPAQTNPVEQTSVLNSSLIKLTNCTTAISAPPFNSLLSNAHVSEDALERAAHSRLSEAIANGTEKFEAFPFADHFVAIKAPTGFTRLTDAPSLFVNASRNGKMLEANISKLVLEHYAVVLEQQQSYGRVNLTVFTTTKPLIQQSILVDLGSFWRNPSAISAVFENGFAGFRKDTEVVRSSVYNLTSHWINQITKDAHKVQDKFRPALANATKSSTGTGIAAGAATWKTIMFARNNTAAELSRFSGVFSNYSQPRQVLQAVYNLSNRTRLALTRARNSSNQTIQSGMARVLPDSFRLFPQPAFLHWFGVNFRRSPPQPKEGGKKGPVIRKMRDRAVRVRDWILGKKPTSKAVGASLLNEPIRATGPRGQQHIRVNREKQVHTKSNGQAKQISPKRKESHKAGKHGENSKGAVRQGN